MNNQRVRCAKVNGNVLCKKVEKAHFIRRKINRKSCLANLREIIGKNKAPDGQKGPFQPLFLKC
jgi:hypothetical protein